MHQRLGLIAGSAVVLSAFVLLGVYEVQVKTMPDWLFWSVVTLAGLVLVASVSVWLFVYVVVSIGRWLKSWEWRLPATRKGVPGPHEWLLDIAREDADNPARHLLILKQMITNMDLRPDTRRPWIELGFTLYNGGVHNILVGPVKGHAHFKGDELSDPVEGAGGKSNKPRGHVHEYKLKQYLPADVAEAIYDEICRTQRIRSLGLSKVTLEVRAQTPGGQTVQMPLGSNATFMRPD